MNLIEVAATDAGGAIAALPIFGTFFAAENVLVSDAERFLAAVVAGKAQLLNFGIIAAALGGNLTCLGQRAALGSDGRTGGATGGVDVGRAFDFFVVACDVRGVHDG